MKIGHPIRILQFGEGNFLRAFAGWMVDITNEKTGFDGSIAIVKPRPGKNWKTAFYNQDCNYTVTLRGLVDAKPTETSRLITSVAEVLDPCEDYDRILELACSEDLQFIISNTTESGISCSDEDDMSGIPPVSFPAKLTKLLLERWTAFRGIHDQHGLSILPTELIGRNGDMLKSCVLQTALRWNLPEEFCSWVDTGCYFCNTLVDRIVTGHEKDSPDPLQVAAEPYAFWAIEDRLGILTERFPLQQAGLPVCFVSDIDPYQERKVRILNGAHTGFVPFALLHGYTYVNETMNDPRFEGFVQMMLREEVIPTLTLPRTELERFARDVLERFRNPFINHALIDIAQNSVMKWGTRCLPSLLDYYDFTKKLPVRLAASLAALLAFYSGPHRNLLHDDPSILTFFEQIEGNSAEFRTARFFERFYDGALCAIPGLAEKVSEELAALEAALPA